LLTIIIREKKRSFVIITDIGRDIDDTLALIVLLALHKEGVINIHSIIVSGLNLDNRAILVKYWINKFGITNDIPIYKTMSTTDTRNKEEIEKDDNYKCIVPKDDEIYKNVSSITFGNLDDKIIQDKYLNTKLEYIVLSSPLPLKQIIKKYKANETFPIEKVYIQGSFVVYDKNVFPENNKTLKELSNSKHQAFNPLLQTILAYFKENGIEKNNPYIENNQEFLTQFYANFTGFSSAYNLNGIKGTDDFANDSSANYIFTELQDKCEIHCLGKNTAYLFKLKEEHLVENTLKDQAKDGLRHFFTNQKIFHLVYKDLFKPDEINSLSKKDSKELEDNFDKKIITRDDDSYSPYEIINADRVSNAYDLITVILALYPDWFNLPTGVDNYTRGRGITHYNYNEKDKRILKYNNDDYHKHHSEMIKSLLDKCMTIMDPEYKIKQNLRNILQKNKNARYETKS